MNRKIIVAVLLKNKNLLKKTGAFFRQSKTFKMLSCSDVISLDNLLTNDRPPSAVITEESFIPGLPDKTTDTPVIALINAKTGNGLSLLAKSDVSGYIRLPFSDEELDYQLRNVIACRTRECGLKQKIKDLQTLYDLTQLITSTLDPKELLYLIVKKISEIMPVTRCSIIRIDWANKVAYVVASFETPNIQTIKLNLKKYPEIIEALVKKKPVFIKDISTDPLMQSVRDIVSPLGIRSILVLPIILEEKVIGTLFLRTSRKNHAFSEDEIRLLQTISDASANTLNNAFLFAQVEDEKTRLEKLAITDYLTGIYNIRYFYHRIVEEFSRSERYSIPISCLMLDIDYFKKINDTYGHKTGDSVLKEFAHLLKKLSRRSDVLARYGGEEFIIMLPHTTTEGAMAEAERIRHSVRQHQFRSLKNRQKITISIGISTYPHKKICSHDDLISAADDALYTAKNSGRDRFVLFK